MKKIIAISIISLLASNIIIAQEYQKLIEENKIWYVLDVTDCQWSTCYRTYIYKFQQDTSINGMKYYNSFRTSDSTFHSFGNLGYFLREDTIDKKVYVWDESENKEKLIYDFSLNTGDTIFIDNPNWTQVELVVENVDTIELNNSARRRIKLKETNKKAAGEEFWIEGIGSTSGILQVGINFTLISPRYELLCVSQNDQQLYSIGQPCYLSNTGEDKYNNYTTKLKIIPNPIVNESIISFEDKAINDDLIIQITNMYGQICLQETFRYSFDHVISKKDYKPGIYTATVLNSRGYHNQLRFIIIN